MKKVIKRSEMLFRFSDIKNSSIIGIQGSPTERFSIIKDVMTGGEVCYRLVSPGLDLTELYSCPPYKSKKDCVRTWMDFEGVEVFVFDTPKQLFNWLVENNQ
jgi:hypothetical protein